MLASVQEKPIALHVKTAVSASTVLMAAHAVFALLPVLQAVQTIQAVATASTKAVAAAAQRLSQVEAL
ncbi:hypothetical protein CAP35_13660 [Chitinophagaceae bacterium IBVUCB1]|nr:hypothetical protein CAP35_13660 [Chitinophagaceae bacterium IBVUCB1]